MKSEQLKSLELKVLRVREGLALISTGNLRKSDQDQHEWTSQLAAQIVADLAAITVDQPTPEEVRHKEQAAFVMEWRRGDVTEHATTVVVRLKRLVEESEGHLSRYQASAKSSTDAGELSDRLQHDILWSLANMQSSFDAMQRAARELAGIH